MAFQSVSLVLSAFYCSHLQSLFIDDLLLGSVDEAAAIET